MKHKNLPGRHLLLSPSQLLQAPDLTYNHEETRQAKLTTQRNQSTYQTNYEVLVRRGKHRFKATRAVYYHQTSSSDISWPQSIALEFYIKNTSSQHNITGRSPWLQDVYYTARVYTLQRLRETAPYKNVSH